jgi:mono/diheme cytochrome c family protein
VEILAIVLTLGLWGPSLAAPGDDDADLAAARAAALKTFKDQVTPFLNAYCIRCHGEKKKRAGITFEYAVKSPATPTFKQLWSNAVANIKNHTMPPEKEEKQPTPEERQAVVGWVANLKYLSPKDPGEFVIRRLNRTEYGNTLVDLFGVDPKIAAELPEEVFGAGYTNSVSPLLMEKILAVTNEVLGRVPARFFEGAPDGAADFARSLARKAYRRPATEAEIALLMRVHSLATAAGRSLPDARRLMVKAMLVSPQFLFITPDGADDAGSDIVRLGNHQLASRLSYLLWAAPPDGELSDLADAGKLHDPAVLAAQSR